MTNEIKNTLKYLSKISVDASDAENNLYKFLDKYGEDTDDFNSLLPIYDCREAIDDIRDLADDIYNKLSKAMKRL